VTPGWIVLLVRHSALRNGIGSKKIGTTGHLNS
jgi:hypothetical protein